MAERAEEGMDNENVRGAESGSPSPKSQVVDAAALDERDRGMQKYGYGDDAVPERKNEELLASLRQSGKAGNAVKLEDEFASPLDPASALLPPLDEQETSAPIQDASEKGGLIDSKHAAEEALVNMELDLEESRQGEAPVEIEQESGKKASAEIEHELDVEPFVEVRSIALEPLESELEQQYRVPPQQAGNTGGPEWDAGYDNSGPGENDIKPQERLLNDVPGTSFMKGNSQEASDVQHEAPELVEKDIDAFEVNPEKSEEQVEEYSVSKELNEQLDLETSNGNVSDEPPAAATVPDEALLMKEPSLSTPAMEALIEADNEEPTLQEGFGTVEDSEQHLETKETHEESAATGSDGQDAFEGISNQVEVDKNEQERTENNAFGEDDSPKGAAESAKEVIVSSGQELGLDTPADQQDGKEAEPSLVFEQETEKPPINEAPSTDSCVEQEPDIEEPLAVEQEPLEQSLDTAPSSSDLEMAADINEQVGEALLLKAVENTTRTGNAEGEVAATSEVVEGDATTNRLEETNPENEPRLQALNGEQAPNNPYNKESDETFNKQLETKGLFAGQDKFFIQINNEAFPSVGETEAESKNAAANGQLDEDDRNKRGQDEQVSVIITPCSDTSMEANLLIENCEKSSSQSEPASEREHQGQGIGNTSTITQLETTCDDISNGALETSEAPNKNHLSEHVLENGDLLRRHPSGENGGEVGEGSYVGHSTALVLGKVIDGMTEGEATITTSAEKGLVYHDITAEDDKQGTSEPLIYNNSECEDEYSEVSEVETQAAEAKGREIDAVKGQEIVGATKEVPSRTDATSTSDSLVLENGLLKHSEGNFENEYEAKVYTNGTAIMCITDKENVQAFHNERSREASLSMVVPQQKDRPSDHVGQKDTDRTNGRVTLARRTNWWGCCGMLDLLLHKDE